MHHLYAGIRKIAAVLLIAMLPVILPKAAAGERTQSDPARQLADAMTTEEKIAQMIMPSIRYYTDGAKKTTGVKTLPEDLRRLFSVYPFAGVILYAQNLAGTEQALLLTNELQEAAASGRLAETADETAFPQLMIAADQEGGQVTRLASGCQTPGNMALAAARNPAVTIKAAELIGSELAAVGINTDFAPVVDVNVNPANPVIGIRSFSDDPEMTARQGRRFMQALSRQGVIPVLKHFPGHGDTGMDSHSSLPRVNKTFERIRSCELVPFQACIDAGADMIMTAHIQYPAIEEEKYVTADGRSLYLPATLSKKVLTGLLREKMGFQGVVITDSMQMAAISANFLQTEAARLAIEAGADILLMPVEIRNSSGVAELENYIHSLAAMVREGKISEERIDESVTRILRLKEKYGLLEPYVSDLSARTAKALETVGSAANHEAEEELAKRCITLVKNDGGLLPFSPKTKSYLVVVPYASELKSVRYAFNDMIDRGVLAEDTVLKVVFYGDVSREEIFRMASEAEQVIAVSAVYKLSELNSDSADGAYTALVSALIDAVHADGKRIAVLSANLPYDLASFEKADALAAAYLARGMSEDPAERENGVASYGPNLPAALRLMLDPDAVFYGRLPLDIPASGYYDGKSGEILFPRGSGLAG